MEVDRKLLEDTLSELQDREWDWDADHEESYCQSCNGGAVEKKVLVHAPDCSLEAVLTKLRAALAQQATEEPQVPICPSDL